MTVVLLVVASAQLVLNLLVLAVVWIGCRQPISEPGLATQTIRAIEDETIRALVYAAAMPPTAGDSR